ncbi:MAG: trypsin-like serine protease [bacterium]|nr:trypsin-like serine protease [bacterium]
MKCSVRHICYRIAEQLLQILLSVFLLGLSGSSSPAQTVQFVPLSFADIAEAIQPSVVNVSTSQIIGAIISPGDERQRETPPFETGPIHRFKRRSLGSGVLIDKKGYIITNNHVIEDADEIRVTLSDGEEFQADIIGRDVKTDIALIKIRDVRRDFPVATFGDSDPMRVGEWVIAVGNPYGLSHTVTAGIISAKGRVIDGPYDDFIQTDASINPGNSGGPLINIQGQVIGINTAIFGNTPGNRFAQGIGFAIPVNIVRQVISDLRQYGKVKRGWVGIVIQQVTQELAESFNLPDTRGALVTSVIPEGPADTAGIFRGDVILKFNDIEIHHSIDLPRIAADNPPGTECTLRVNRDGEEIAIDITLGEFPNKQTPISPLE